MALPFSNTSTKNGILEQTRDICRTDATRYPTQKVVNSCNNWLDFITGYALLKDRKFQWDDSNHTDLPIGTTDLVANQSDYSFLTDENGNEILTLLRIDVKDSSGNWTQLISKDIAEIDGAVDEFESTAGVPKYYDKVSDNSVRIFPVSSANVTGGLKFYFQRTGSYFVAADTTKTPGVPSPLHRGFVIASAFDCSLTLGLNNLQALSIERDREIAKIETYFSIRNQDEPKRMKANVENTR